MYSILLAPSFQWRTREWIFPPQSVTSCLRAPPICSPVPWAPVVWTAIARGKAVPLTTSKTPGTVGLCQCMGMEHLPTAAIVPGGRGGQLRSPPSAAHLILASSAPKWPALQRCLCHLLFPDYIMSQENKTLEAGTWLSFTPLSRRSQSGNLSGRAPLSLLRKE